MELNKNFDGSTKLCDWYKIIRQNLQKIETEFSNKCNAADVEKIFAEKIDTSAETIEAIEALRQEYGNVGSAAAAICELAGGRMKILTDSGKSFQTLLENTKSVIEATGVTGAPGGDTKGLLINASGTALWFSSTGEIYQMYSGGTWGLVASKAEMSKVNRETVSGIYTGSGSSADRNIDLGFEPAAVRVIQQYGSPVNGKEIFSSWAYAYKDYPVNAGTDYKLVITSTGFTVGTRYNSNGVKYIFEADKNIDLTVIE